VNNAIGLPAKAVRLDNLGDILNQVLIAKDILGVIIL